ncbi:NAD(P)/FAD-dependent oxidoreductase [Enterovirga aerilata]|uniref:NAD(P)/FAD-dependent oxidoreductase n=1 Tax=Enterovirga aerilata TaxID=2730920 RepID=UPI003211DE91
MNRDHHVVIVGGGFDGLATAQGLGNAPGIRVTLVDRRNHHLFQPLLYQVATAVLSPGEVAQPIRSILRKHRRTTVLLGEVRAVDPAGRTVTLTGGGELAYDTLVIATGATHSYFGHPEWAKFAPGLKTLDDARRIRRSVLQAFEDAERALSEEERRRCLTFAIIGGGPTGVEMAGAIAGLARQALVGEFRNIRPEEARVLLIEAGPRILAPFPETLSSYAERALARLGVTVMTGRPVENIDADGVTAAGEVISAATVIWGAGVQASPAGRWLGVETDRAGRVRVEPDLAVEGLAHVYVLGDASLLAGEDRRPLPGLAQVAQQQGEYLGRALRGQILRAETPPPFKFRNRGNLAVIGRKAAVVQWDSVQLKGFPAFAFWAVAHVYLLVGFQNRLIVSLRWLWAYLTKRRGSRIIPESSS